MDIQNLIIRTGTALVLGALFWLAFIYLPPIYFSGILLLILAQIIIFEWTRLFDLHQPTFWLLMPIYPVLPFLLLIALNHDMAHRTLLFILFILVSSHDSGSYIVGNLFGKHKLAPAISPKKTWEGFLGGWVFATIGLVWMLAELDVSLSYLAIASFSLIVCILSLFGDLFESWLKRRAAVKDSGDILPGHGGFLDRFDGILFTVFFFYFLRDYLTTIFKL